MEYDLSAFANRIRDTLYDNFPVSKTLKNPSGSLKHPNRKGHARDYAFKNLPMIHSDDKITFDIGSENAELNYPHYHILEDAEVIHTRGKGTKTSKGSQDQISDKKARDYGKVNWNGKTFTQEYKKNVRGIRSKTGKAKQYFVDSNGVVFAINANANSYVNVHYQYIERTLNATLSFIANDMGLKMLRVQNSGLGEEVELGRQSDLGIVSAENILDIINSFMED